MAALVAAEIVPVVAAAAEKALTCSDSCFCVAPVDFVVAVVVVVVVGIARKLASVAAGLVQRVVGC